MLAPLAAEREAASAELDFERAARVHEQWQRVKAAQSLADSLVQPIPNLRAIILQKAAQPEPSRVEAGTPKDVAGIPKDTVILNAVKDPCISPDPPQHTEPAAAVFLLQSGCLAGPARLSTLGVRAVKEQTSVGSSLFAQPLMLGALPLAVETQAADITTPLTPAESPEVRATALITSLEEQASAPTDLATLSDHLSLLRRWYYRPEKQRLGEVFFPKEDGAAANKETAWPIRRILNGAARLALGDPKPLAETQRDLATRNPADAAQKPTRTKTLHPGRPDVERTVPIPDKIPERHPYSPSKPAASPTHLAPADTLPSTHLHFN